MLKITVTDLTKKLKEVLHKVESKSQIVTILRNGKPVAQIVPAPGCMTAHEAMGDLHCALANDTTVSWLQDSRTKLSDEIRNPWDK